MAAVAASSAKRSLRAELKQRLRALSAEERLRQSHLLTQEVREGCGELKAWKRGLGLNVCAGATLPLCVRVLVGARSHLQSGPVIAHSQYQNSKRISIFLSMQDEIETEEMIKDIFKQGKICFIPRYRCQSNHMDMVRLASPEEISLLPKTSWNIHQPSEGDVREEALSTGQTNVLIFRLKTWGGT